MYRDGRGRRRRHSHRIKVQSKDLNRYMTHYTTSDIRSDCLTPTNRGNNLPAHRLWASVLERAILDFQYPTGRGPDNIQRHAKLFFANPSIEVGSFQWICQHLHVEPTGVLRRINFT